ncbi:MAG: arsenic metallochaperone ArsD family protein [Bacillota bacterium]
MKKVEVFDPAICCSPAINPEELRFTALVRTLEEKGMEIIRYNSSREPQVYMENEAIMSLLQTEGMDALPATLVDGKVFKTKEYPSNEELSVLLGVTLPTK